MNKYKILSSGSHGNCVIYHDSIVIDIGIPYSLIKPYIMDIQIVLLTHVHGDHLSLVTLEKLQFERPTLRIITPIHILKHVDHLKNLDIVEAGILYDYGVFQIQPIKLYHDVENFGYRIFKEGHKIIHATDTSHLAGVTAHNYDLYMLEHNYNEETIDHSIAAIEANGGFAHQRGSANTHLSEQQANDFFFNNKGENSEVVRLHESKTR